ncbi:MAG: AzlC family ABC transporter permease [Spirochaeta sp.]|nr:AzlC family ABC transporter permease [Spirochaeta sp.]
MTSDIDPQLPSSTTQSGLFRRALADTLPFVLGILPFGIAYAIVGISNGLTPLEVISMSILVFAGSAQMVAAGIAGDPSAGVAVFLFTTLMLNVRHVLLGASSAIQAPNRSRLEILVQSFFLTDEVYAIASARARRHGHRTRYYLSAGVFFYLGWIGATVVGVLSVSFIQDPFALPLDFIMPATFIVLLVPFVEDKAGKVAALGGGLAAVVGALVLPGHWYIIIAGLLGSALGAWYDARFASRSDSDARTVE